jgi:putative tricarboxylic transport membrane protein
MEPPRSSRRGAVGAAVALLVVVAIAAWQVALIPEPTIYSAVGPTAMPAALVALIGALGIAYLVQSLRGRSADVLDDPEETPLPGPGRRVALMVAGLAALLLLTRWIGIGAASVICFVFVARAFDSRRWLRDLVVGIVASLVFWYLFDQLLGVQLGPFIRFG